MDNILQRQVEEIITVEANVLDRLQDIGRVSKQIDTAVNAATAVREDLQSALAEPSPDDTDGLMAAASILDAAVDRLKSAGAILALAEAEINAALDKLSPPILRTDPDGALRALSQGQYA